MNSRLWLYLYSTRHIVACLLALLGPVLLFLGVIHDYWLLITVGLYGIGFLMTPAPQTIVIKTYANQSFAELLTSLDTLLSQTKSHIPQEAQQHLSHIRQAVADVLPRVAEQSFDDNNLFIIRETIGHYLPETLNSYLALPVAFRLSHPVREGKTARQLLLEQLQLLDNKMQEVVMNIAQGDARALVANGEFLQARFKPKEFLRVE